MTEKSASLRQRLAYAVVWVAAAIFSRLPLRCGVVVAHFGADLAFWLGRKHRTIALDNLRESFPGRWSEPELRRVGRRVYRHLAVMLLELLFFSRKIRSDNWRERISGLGIPVFLDAISSGEPLLVVTGHFGNWELGGYLMGLWGAKGYVVARPLNNPLLDRVFVQLREQSGMTVVNKLGAVRSVCTKLNADHICCLLADQDAGPTGTFVSFFGRTASTTSIVELVARRTNATIVVVGVRRGDRPLDYVIDVSEVIRPEEYRGQESTLTQRVTTALEAVIEKAPEQYLWLHRRWKTRPGAARIPRKAA